MPSQGPFYPSTLASSNANGGAVAWTNPNNAATSNNSYATCAANEPETTEVLRGTNFGFSIPSNATITGIELRVEGNVQGDVSFVYSTANLTKNGTSLIGSITLPSVGFNNGAGNSSPTDVTDVLGGSSSLWSLSWTPAEINTSTFGVGFSFLATDISGTVRVDTFSLTVYYSLPSGSSTSVNPQLNTLPSRLSKNSSKATLITSGFSSGVTHYQIQTYDRQDDFTIRSNMDISQMPQIVSVNAAQLGILLRERTLYRVRVRQEGGSWGSWETFKTRSLGYKTVGTSNLLDNSYQVIDTRHNARINVTNVNKATVTETSRGARVVNSNYGSIKTTSITYSRKGARVVNSE